MEILEIPEQLEMPGSASGEVNPISMADYLMTMLFQRQPAMLHAEFRNGDGRWLVQSALEDESVAESKQVPEFRAILARFGAHFMEKQLHGGHTRLTVIQQQRKFACRFFMSNDSATGYWIRVYAYATA